MAGTSLAAPHPTITNLYPMITDSRNSNLILLAYCTGTPDTTTNTYEHGALMIQIDSGTGTNGIYQNTGSSASPVWTLLDTGTAFSLPTVASDATTTTGDSFALTMSTLTSGNGLKITGSGAAMLTGGNLANILMGAATVGAGLNVSTTGVYTGGGVVKVTANSLTTGSMVVLSATGQTSGIGFQVTGGGATLLTAGIVADVEMGAATVGSGVKVVTSGVYTDAAAAVVNIVASSATIGNVLMVTTTSSAAFKVGQAAATPAFQVDSSTASQAAGLKVTGAATGGTVAIAAIDSGSNTNITLDGKGSGTIVIGGTSTGFVSIGRGSRSGLLFNTTVASLGTTQNSTPSAAQLLGGVVTQTGATGAGTVTTPTGTVLSAAIPGVATGDSFDCVFANLGGGFNLTITAGVSGMTVVGNAVIPSGKVGYLTFVNTGSNTWNCYVVVSA